jgi:arylsulfatase
VFDFTYDGPGMGKGGTGSLKVDGNEVANQKIPHTAPALLNLARPSTSASTRARR